MQLKKIILLSIVVILTLLLTIFIKTDNVDNFNLQDDINQNLGNISNKIFNDNNLITYGHINTENRNFLLSFFDLKENREVNQIDLGDIFARKVFYNQESSQIWVPAEYEKNLQNISNKIKIFDINKGLIKEMEVGLSPVDVQFIDDTAIVTSLERGIKDVTVYLINTESLEIVEKIIIGGDNFTFSEIDKENNRAYFITQDVDNRISKLSVIDINLMKILNQFEYPSVPLYGIKLIKNELWLAGGNKIQIVNPLTNEILKTLQTEVIPYELQYNGINVYLTHYNPTSQEQKGISIIDPNNFEINKLSLTQRLPSNIVVKDNYLYIVDEMDGVLEIINLSTLETIYTTLLGKFPTNLVIIGNNNHEKK